MRHIQFISPTIAALGAAVFFGASTPFSKELVGQISPISFCILLSLFRLAFWLDKDGSNRGCSCQMNSGPYNSHTVTLGLSNLL